VKQLCETPRLIIRQFNHNDAEFIVRLLNEESFIENIADKQIRNNADAKEYLTNGPMASYQHFGFGLNAVLLKGCATPIGICGLLKRAELDHPDLGYAFLPEFCGKGYAQEAADAVLKNVIATHALKTILAVTSLTNQSSHNLLKKVNFSFTGTVEIYGSQSNIYEYQI